MSSLRQERERTYSGDLADSWVKRYGPDMAGVQCAITALLDWTGFHLGQLFTT